MIWQTCEQTGKQTLNHSMAEQLGAYLQAKELQLSSQILQGFTGRLSDAISEFGKMGQTTEAWQNVVRRINHALWHYVEMLEGSTIELFQQIDQIGFEDWSHDLSYAMSAIKDELIQRMDDLIWGMHRLEHQLKIYRRLNDKRFLWRVTWGTKLLDRSLEATVRRCEKFLNFRYWRFVDGYRGYLQLHETATRSLPDLNAYQIFQTRDVASQELFKRLYLMLTIWEENSSARVFPRKEPFRAVRGVASPERIYNLFHDYLSSIRAALFEQSRTIKKPFHFVFNDKEGEKAVFETVEHYRQELHWLHVIATKYRKFLIQTDFVRISWWKSEESKRAKQIKILLQDIKYVDALCGDFQLSLEAGPKAEKEAADPLKRDIENHLHAMGQPLASKDLLRRHAKAILHDLQQIDELGSCYVDTVEYVCHVLCRAIRSDWKYHVLEDQSLFHQLYEIHSNLVKSIADRQHFNRLNKFREFLEHLNRWIESKETLQHTQEIELEMSDVKAYLQDFFAQVQRVEKTSGKKSMALSDHAKAMESLLEYLYLFGGFFHRLRAEDPEQWLIRKQLLFVDQYFEAIDDILQTRT